LSAAAALPQIAHAENKIKIARPAGTRAFCDFIAGALNRYARRTL
jgi:hypothetical protein